MVDNIKPCSPRKCPPQIENSDQDLRDICYNKAHSIYGPDLPPVVVERLERELNSIISNGYAVMYIIAQKLVWKSNEDGYLVGSRGSGRFVICSDDGGNNRGKSAVGTLLLSKMPLL